MMLKSKSGEWWRVLLAARAVAEDALLDSGMLSDQAGLDVKWSSMWLCKFAKWGYVVKDGVVRGGRGRPFIRWRLTKYGLLRSKKWKGPIKAKAPQELELRIAANPKKKEPKR